MSFRKTTLFIALLLAVLSPACSLAQQSRETKIDPKSVGDASRVLRERIAGAVKDAGGDPEQQQLHLVLGFSTGHFSQDPLSAQAAREIASSLVRDLLVRDDRLSVYAWEMDLWDTPQVKSNPVVVPADNGPEKSRLQDLWPLTPRTGSVGGHDTEKAIVGITSAVQSNADTVIVLLTNTAASISAPGIPVIGSNDSDYHKAVQGWNRLPQVNKSGASAVLPYTVIPVSGAPLARWLDAVIVAPRRFSSTTWSGPSRSQRLSAPTAPTPVKREAHDWTIPLILLGLVALAGLGYLAAKYWPQPGTLLLSVADQRYPLIGAPGEEICHLAGPGYPEPTAKTIILGADCNAPSVRLARFRRHKGATVRVEGDALKVASYDGISVIGDTILKEGRHRLVLRGEVAADPALPPQQVELPVDVEIQRA